ncbi:hypothetical protein NQ317_014516 [Molorchus minor]|uniref:Endonuclease/exonuclease/phosphatase domain-containing protein n=1 Tax=Molorchus minor TaxID=1323400 RepID=A0ABQ9IRA7_9CUCU|nr:hypothetical protein NQ317_014516 [Molorchus minor]
MDPYIRDFKANSIKTENVLTAQNASSVLELKGYTMIYNEASYNQNDGTIIYIRNDIDNIDYTIEKISNTSLINLRFCLNGRSYNLYAMYRPPSTNIIEYIDALQIYLQNQNLKYDYSLFVGDINIDISKSTLHSDDYLNIMSEFGFKSIINDYTRIQENSKSCLDHIFIHSKYDIEDVILPLIMHTNITDHFPVLCQLVLEAPTTPNEVKQCISRLKPNKSPGIDDIKSTTIKHMADEISQYIKETINLKNLMILYKSLVESHITYGIIGWGGVLNTHLQRLEVIQKRILKIILNKPYTYPSDELFQETNMFSEKKDKAKHDYQTRNRNIGNLPVVLMRTSTGQRSSTKDIFNN